MNPPSSSQTTDSKKWYPLDIIQWTSDYFKSKDIPNPRLDAELLLAHVLKCSRIDLYVHFKKEVSLSQRELYKELIQRRYHREPLQYITGVQEFFGLSFLTNPSVLIPRPETELMIEIAKKILTNVEEKYSLLDIGTGSGCLAITLAKEFPHSTMMATEISKEALAVAQKNAERNQIENIVFVLTDLSPKLSLKAAQHRFDMIVSNPPYIARSDFDTLQPEVRDYEPRLALDGGHNGLDFYPRILQDATELLKDNGWLLLEIGAGQVEKIKKLIDLTESFSNTECVNDYHDIPRILKTKRSV